jgi:hypothetical protein
LQKKGIDKLKIIFLRLYKPLLHEVVHFSSVTGSIFRTLHNHPTAFELQIKHFKQFYKLFFCQEYCNYIAKTQHIWFIYYHDKFTETGRKKCCGYHDFVTCCIFKICVLELKMKAETYIIESLALLWNACFI